MRRPVLALVALATTIAALLASRTALAEPYLAQREGFKCGKCHVNRTGGGKRTAFGHQYAVTHLGALRAAPWGGRDARLFDPHLNDFISVGANLRLASTTAFAEKVHNTFESQEANFYLELDASPALLLYADTSVAGGSVENREAFLLLSGPRGLSLKAGYFLLPYGLRLWGDDEFVRRETGYDYAAPDLGLEVGIERGALGAFLAVSNGAGGGLDADNDKKISFLGEAAWRRFRLGLSGSFNRTPSRTSYLAGAFLGAQLGRLTLLGEADLIGSHYDAVSEDVFSLVALVEADFRFWRGVNLKLTYGYHDPALDVREDQRMSARAALELYPFPFLGVAVAYGLRQSIPQDEVGNADILVGELHLFL